MDSESPTGGEKLLLSIQNMQIRATVRATVSKSESALLERCLKGVCHSLASNLYTDLDLCHASYMEASALVCLSLLVFFCFS